MKTFYRLTLALTVSAAVLSCGAEQPEAQDQVLERPAAKNTVMPVADASVPENELEPFLLEGHEILDSQRGDINNDKRDDVILIQKATNEKETSDISGKHTPRPLMLLVRQPNGTLTLAARNDSVVLCVDCGGIMGDPYEGITINGNYFSVGHYGGSSWRWTKIITFKYNTQKQDWYLHKDGGVSFHASAPDSTLEETVETTKDFGVIKFREYNVYSNLD